MIQFSLSGPILILTVLDLLVAAGACVYLVFFARCKLLAMSATVEGLRQAIDSSLMGREANRNPFTIGLRNCLTACRDRGLQCNAFVAVGAKCGEVAKDMQKVFPYAAAYMIEPPLYLREPLTDIAADGELLFRYSLIDHFRGGTGALSAVPQAEAFLDQEAMMPVRSLDSLTVEGLYPWELHDTGDATGLVVVNGSSPPPVKPNLGEESGPVQTQ